MRYKYIISSHHLPHNISLSPSLSISYSLSRETCELLSMFDLKLFPFPTDIETEIIYLKLNETNFLLFTRAKQKILEFNFSSRNDLSSDFI